MDTQPELQPQEAPLVDERMNTDESLTAERKKATEALNTAGSKTRTQTDRVVKDERIIADQTTASSRTDHDESREGAAHGLKTAVNQSQLVEERHVADLATERERSRVDAAITQEREVANRLVATMLDRERDATDKNLSVERNATDTHLNSATDQLGAEVAEHEKTRLSVTTRDEFLAIVSHDLRNPIGAVRSYAEIILDKSAYTIDSEIRKYVEAIRRNADASLRLIADLLDVERMTQGKLQIELGLHDMSEIVRDAIETFAVEASERELNLSVELGSRNDQLELDRARVSQVLSNLIGNAVKFTPKGGRIVVSTQSTSEGLQVAVKDTGPGIPANQKEKIFERFAQIGLKDRNGLGLGLYISRMLIEAHGGRLWVESDGAHGSAFSFVLPRRRI